MEIDAALCNAPVNVYMRNYMNFLWSMIMIVVVTFDIKILHAQSSHKNVPLGCASFPSTFFMFYSFTYANFYP